MVPIGGWGMARMDRRSLFTSRIAALLIVLGLLLVACGEDSGSASGSDGVPAEGSTIKVGATLDIGPYAFRDEDNQPAGLEVDMLNAMATELGYKLSYDQVPFEQVFVGLAADTYRFIGAAVIFITCERISGAEGDIEFGVPFYSDDIVITTTKENASKYTTLESLKGLNVGYDAKGSTGDALSQAFLKDHPGWFKQQYFSNIADSSLALEQGRVAATVGSRIAYSFAIKDKTDLVVSGALPDSEFPVGLVFRPGDPLKEKFDQAINDLKESGKLAEIWKTWFGTDPPSTSPVVNVIPPVTATTCKSRG